MGRARTVVVVAAFMAATVVAGGCGSSGGHAAAVVAPGTLLRRSRSVVDATRAVHFTLTSSNVTGSGIQLTGGSGDLVRPDELEGTFSVSSGGLDASVGVVEVGGRFYAEPPFASHYSVTDPAAYGLGNPAELLAPTTGVSSLLTSMSGVRSEGEQRLSGELVEVITGTVPGRDVPVLPDVDKAAPVRLTASIDPSTAQLRRVALAAPFTSPTATTTYTVTLTRYGETTHIVAPPT